MNQEKQRPWSREERHYRRHKGTLRCRWCGRWTEVNPGQQWRDTTWKEWRDIAVFRRNETECQRPRCLLGRM
jgi:hypothetical protein